MSTGNPLGRRDDPGEAPVSRTSWYAADPAVSARRSAGEEAVLFHPDTGGEKSLNRTGSFLWQRLQRPGRLEDLSLDMAGAFESAPQEQVERDVERFLGRLLREGFVRSVDPQGVFDSSRQQDLPGLDDGPWAVDVSITGRCNLRCPYCFYQHEMDSQADLPAEQWLLFFEELGRLAVRAVCLSGGEVLLRPDMWEIVDGLIENRMRYSLNTNGTRITEQVIAELHKGKRRKRLDGIQVSIDGSCAEVNDKTRGRGAFEKTRAALRLLREAGLPVTARVTVNPYNAHDLEPLAGLLLDDIGIRAFSTNDAVPMGAGLVNPRAVGLGPDQRLEAMKTLERLERDYPGRVTAAAGPLAQARRFKAMERARACGPLEQGPESSSMGYLTACGGVFHKLAVTHGGAIVPCVMLSEVELGVINSDSVSKIWTSHPTLIALRERGKTPLSEVPGCEDCEWNRYCTGGCPGLSLSECGDFNCISSYDCCKRYLGPTPLSSPRAGGEAS